ncbi:MAG TPA: DUF1707 domain-containing protein [Jiangellaceae bacterium]|jgi:hypothetical protein
MSTSEQEAGPRRVRAGDAERERAVEQLRRHHEEGRLDSDEFTERMEVALAARWVDELPGLLTDLPGLDRVASTEPQGRRGEGARGRRGQWRPFAPVVGAIVAVVVVLVVIGSIGAIANGFFPFPLLWLLFGLFLFKPWFRHRFHHASRQQ